MSPRNRSDLHFPRTLKCASSFGGEADGDYMVGMCDANSARTSPTMQPESIIGRPVTRKAWKDRYPLDLLISQCLNRIQCGGAACRKIAKRHTNSGRENKRQENDGDVGYERYADHPGQ